MSCWSHSSVLPGSVRRFCTFFNFKQRPLQAGAPSDRQNRASRRYISMKNVKASVAWTLQNVRPNQDLHKRSYFSDIRLSNWTGSSWPVGQSCRESRTSTLIRPMPYHAPTSAGRSNQLMARSCNQRTIRDYIRWNGKTNHIAALAADTLPRKSR